MRSLAAAAILLTAACTSTSAVEPAAMPSAPPPDPATARLQVAMTELLERLDVLNDRIARLEKAGEERMVPAAGEPAWPQKRLSAPAAAQKPLQAASLAEAYRNAIVLVGKNRLTEARNAFQRVFDSDPSGELADNALFWIGETYYAGGDYNSAIRYYKRVTDEYGDQNKAPDAMFKLALAYEKSSDLAQARITLQEVMARYPYSAPAASAKSELNRIKY